MTVVVKPDQLSSEELEELLLKKANSTEIRLIIEAVAAWAGLTIVLLALYFIAVPKELQVYLFGSSFFFTSFILSLFIFLMQFVMNFAVGMGSGFSAATLVFSKEALDVEYHERLRMWDTSWGMLGPFLLALISLMLYFIFG